MPAKELYLLKPMGVDRDKYILHKLSEGDIEALDVLYLLYAPKVKDFAFRFLGDTSASEDITHDIFLKVWKDRKNVANARSLKGYLFRMTRNAIFNEFKHRQVQYRYGQSREAEHMEPAETGDPVTADELMEMIDAAIAGMPEQRRKVFTMSRYEDMSYNDIAEALDISPKTVQYHISCALADLRRLLSAMLFFMAFLD